jgi:hypothetical protein
MKYCETLKVGFYLIQGDRCFFTTGTTKGNKWINLDEPNPQWNSIMWNCIDKYEIDLSVFHTENPTKFNLK